MSNGPLCFVLMPFGSKSDPTGRPNIDFNQVYEKGIQPAIVAAGMMPVRADEEKTGGIIHKPMFERLLLCEYAVADLTTANANVFYELGVRHTALPRTTQAIFAKHQPIPFDVNYLRALPYDLGENNQFGDEEAAALKKALTERLKDLRKIAVEDATADSPVFQLFSEWAPGKLGHDKTDVFRQQVQINEERKARMARARALPKAEGLKELKAIEVECGDPDTYEVGVVIDLMLSFRALEAWTEMIELYECMPEELKRQPITREQLAFALNRRAGDKNRTEGDRIADRQRALKVLTGVEEQQGPNPETCGLIGRIYKDMWDETRKSDGPTAREYLRRSIDAYVRGYQADLSDTYPGINAVTLLDVRGDAASKKKRDELVPVVRFAVGQSLLGKSPDYWDYATMLELAVLSSDRESAQEHLDLALGNVREVWEPRTTARNLNLIREARAQRNEDVAWLDEIVSALEARAAR
jgi:hypothetical protein